MMGLIFSRKHDLSVGGNLVPSNNAQIYVALPSRHIVPVEK